MAVFELELMPQKTHLLYVEVCCDQLRHDGRRPRGAFPSALRASRRALRGLSAGVATVTTSNEIFNEAVGRSMSDPYMLATNTPYGPYPYAGHTMVQHLLRPRRADHRDGNAVAGSGHRTRRARLPGGEPGDNVRSVCRCRARQDPARKPQGRNGEPRRGAVPSLLRQHRFHAAVRHAGRRLPGPHA
ncbi:hypothetical protein ACTMU2_38935 [Cupriavidus basilensis]